MGRYLPVRLALFSGRSVYGRSLSLPVYLVIHLPRPGVRQDHTISSSYLTLHPCGKHDAAAIRCGVRGARVGGGAPNSSRAGRGRQISTAPPPPAQRRSAYHVTGPRDRAATVGRRRHPPRGRAQLDGDRPVPRGGYRIMGSSQGYVGGPEQNGVKVIVNIGIYIIIPVDVIGMYRKVCLPNIRQHFRDVMFYLFLRK